MRVISFLPHFLISPCTFRLTAAGGSSGERMLARLQGVQESNPMLGMRGCRLGIVHPDISEMQVSSRVIFFKILCCYFESAGHMWRRPRNGWYPLMAQINQFRKLKSICTCNISIFDACYPGRPMPDGSQVRVRRGALPLSVERVHRPTGGCSLMVHLRTHSGSTILIPTCVGAGSDGGGGLVHPGRRRGEL